MKKLKLTLLLFFTLFSSAVFSQASSHKVSIYQDAANKHIPMVPLPWHMMQIYWNFDQPTPDCKRIDIDVTIHQDIPETYNLYICPINSGINGIQFYGGIQTNIDGWQTKEDRKKVFPGKGAIFSRWSKDEKQPIGLEYVEKMDDGLCESAGYEGEFCSVRRPYQWTKGTYTFSFITEETITFKDSLHTWASFTVKNKQTEEECKVGRLLFEGEKLQLNNYLGAFVEMYSSGKIPHVQDVLEGMFTFGYPRINGEELPPVNIAAYRPISGMANTPNCAEATSEGNNVTVHTYSTVRHLTTNEMKQFILLDNLKQRIEELNRQQSK